MTGYTPDVLNSIVAKSKIDFVHQSGIELASLAHRLALRRGQQEATTVVEHEGK